MSTKEARLLIAKREHLKNRISSLEELISKEPVDRADIEIRFQRLITMFNRYDDDIVPQLTVALPEENHNVESEEIQNRFYALKQKVTALSSVEVQPPSAIVETTPIYDGPSTSRVHFLPGLTSSPIRTEAGIATEAPATSSVSQPAIRIPIAEPSLSNSHSNFLNTTETPRRVKLPVASLPTFHGHYEGWLAFKNAFTSLINSRSDLPDTEKFLYLRSCLKGDAASKIALLCPSDESYEAAWKILLETYEVKRILISRHLLGLLNLPVQKGESHDGLMNLISVAQQHVAALASLGIHPIPEMLAQILETKLYATTRERWEQNSRFDSFPTFKEICAFLKLTAIRLTPRTSFKTELRSEPKSGEPVSKRQRTASSKQVFLSQASPNCLYCKKSPHFIYRCASFLKLSPLERWRQSKKLNLCINCLRQHKGACTFSSCTICQKPHNMLLHRVEIREAEAKSKETPVVSDTGSARLDSINSDDPSVSILSSIAHVSYSQLILSALVRVRNGNGKFLQARAILDTCASAHFVTENFARRLQLPMEQCSVPIMAVNALHVTATHRITMTFRSTHNNFQKTLTFLVISKISDALPPETLTRESVDIPANLQLADPNFHISRPVDLLIGAGATLSLFAIGQVDLSSNGRTLFLQKTRLGWTIAGELPAVRSPELATCNMTGLETAMVKFWEIKELSTTAELVDEGSACEIHFKQNTKRTSLGRYIVRLPFRDAPTRFENSKSIALRRFCALERKFHSDPTLKMEYSAVLDEYIRMGHMSAVDDSDSDGYFVPHHAVIKPSSTTTRLRVVFDASAKAPGEPSLNEVLMVGPTIQPTLFEHLIRARGYKYLLTADIEKMYRQILIHDDDRRYQRILWRSNDRIQTFELQTVTFGIASAPFLAIRVLHQLANDEANDFPQAARVLKTNFYVDDLITGANDVDELVQLRRDITAILARGGFKIRQWASNDARALLGLDPIAVNSDLSFDKDSILKTLGVYWDATNDSITYTVRPIIHDNRITKRVILSEIAKIFDPLGLLGPVILMAKIIMQMCWKAQVEWDESVTCDLHTMWVSFATQLEHLNNIAINRRIIIDSPINVQIHGFCDASQVGYGACLYVRSVNEQSDVFSQLICAKSRVNPVKGITIPRAELCGALTLARLLSETRRNLNFSIDATFLWCDSSVALHWIRTQPEALQLFVGNRVREIQQLTHDCQWRYVPTSDNPADSLSRGQLPDAFLKNQTWFSGPVWLCLGEDSWPHTLPSLSHDLPELRKGACFHLTVNPQNGNCAEILSRFSSFRLAVRVLARCLRMRPLNKYKGPITVTEKLETEIRILRLTQAEAFHAEIKSIRDLQETKLAGLAALAPFIDKDGLLRVGGRLTHSSLTSSRKHPILLPRKNHVTNIIISDAHLANRHSGIQSTLYYLRHKYWLLDGRNQVRFIVRKCVPCCRFTAQPLTYKMGALPSVRVNQARPFVNTGVDFCGPFYIKEKKYRNRGRVKVYVCVFVCMAIRALHLEVVSDMTTAGFLGALSRFVGRRGIPSQIYSDNGTNFVGASNELREIYALLNSEGFKERVQLFAVDKQITWHFIPPLAPHFGGMWEAGVKSFKHHFKRVIGNRSYTFEELNTLVIEIEAILNSRPICPMSADPNDPEVLTPAHWMIGQPLSSLPEPDLSPVSDNRLSSWQLISKGRQEFWKKWSTEYLGELQKRSKWVQSGEELHPGALVLIKDRGLPPLQWVMGRVTDVHPGLDGVVRVATVKTATTVLKRPTVLLCPLPMD